MPVELSDQEAEQFVLENQILSAEQLPEYKAKAQGGSLFHVLINEGLITYDMQVELERMKGPAQPGTHAAGGVRPSLFAGVKGPAAAPAPSIQLSAGAPKLSPPPSVSGRGRPGLGAPPPTLSGLQAPPLAPAPAAQPPAAGLVPKPSGRSVPPPAAGGKVVVPPPAAGGKFVVPPPKLGGAVVPPPKIAAQAPVAPTQAPSPAPTVAAPQPAVTAPATRAVPAAAPAPVSAPAAHAPAPAAQEAAPAHEGHGIPPEPAGAKKIPEGWPGGVAPDDPTPGHIQDLLKQARARQASDIHLSVGVPIIVRVHGALQPLQPGAPALAPEDTVRAIRQTLTPAQWAHFDRTGDLDLCYCFPSGGRFRMNIVRERNGDGLVARIIGERIFTLQELGLPQQAVRLTEFAQGLVLVTGPSGHGKTTTMMSLVDLVNQNRPDHIITVEEPIEYMIEGKKCHVSQREVGPHTLSFANALKAALRENPDIIVIGELRDYETTSMAINAAETGHLVFASLPTQDAAKTIDKVLDYFPPEEQTQIRLMVSESLRGIISQQLIPKKDGSGRAAAVELLFNSVAVANIIREANTAGLVNAMQLGKNMGMVLMDDSLMNLVTAGQIDGAEAWLRASNKVKFKQFEPKPEGAPKPVAPVAVAKPGAPGVRR